MVRKFNSTRFSPLAVSTSNVYVGSVATNFRDHFFLMLINLASLFAFTVKQASNLGRQCPSAVGEQERFRASRHVTYGKGIKTLFYFVG